MPSRISVLLLSFHYKAWIFGAAYYWLTWVLLVSVLCGSLYSMLHMRFIYIPYGKQLILHYQDTNKACG